MEYVHKSPEKQASKQGPKLRLIKNAHISETCASKHKEICAGSRVSHIAVLYINSILNIRNFLNLWKC